MSNPPRWQWLHSSDWRLGQPIEGIHRPGDSELEELAVEAPYRAVERLVEFALDQQVAGLLLCGNIVDPATCGAAALAFLENVFESLGEGSIDVYWALGELDAADRWPVMPPWPANVHIFRTGVWDSRTVESGGHTLQLSGWSRPAARSASPHFDAAPGRSYHVAVAPEQPALPSNATGPSYVALGGRSAFHTEQKGGTIIRHPGSPQPRDLNLCSEESGITCLAIDQGRLRWHNHRVAPVISVDRECPAAWCRHGDERLRAKLQHDIEQIAEHIAENIDDGVGVSDCHILVRWIIESDRLADVWNFDPSWEHRILDSLQPIRLTEERVVVHPAAMQRPEPGRVQLTSPPAREGLLGDLWNDLMRQKTDANETRNDRLSDLEQYARTLGLDHHHISGFAASWTIARIASGNDAS